MAMYNLLVTFELRAGDGETTQKIFENTVEFESPDAAEDFLESQMSSMISEFSSHSLEWTILEKSIVKAQEQKESDPLAILEL